MLKKLLERFLGWTSSLCFVGLILVVLIQVVWRMIPFLQSPHWTEEASRFLMIYMVAFAAGLAAKERAFVNVDVFIARLGGPIRAFVQFVVDLLSFCLMAVIVWYGWKNAMVGSIQTSASLGIPMHFIFMSMVLHAASVALYTIALMLDDIGNLLGKRREAW